MERIKPFLEKALKKGVDHAILIPTSRVYTEPWVRLKCRYGCSEYGRRLSCPPVSPAPEETRKLLDSYRHAILLHRHLKVKSETLGSFSDLAVTLERDLFLKDFYKAWAMGCGPCYRCRECDTSAPCRHPEKTRPSMEACGIDVFRTAREQGLPIQVVRKYGDERDFYALVLVE